MNASTSEGSPSSDGAKFRTGGLSPGMNTFGAGRFLGLTTFAMTLVYPNPRRGVHSSGASGRKTPKQLRASGAPRIVAPRPVVAKATASRGGGRGGPKFRATSTLKGKGKRIKGTTLAEHNGTRCRGPCRQVGT